MDPKERCIEALKYAMGDGVEADPVRAVSMLRELAAEGDPNGQFGLAEMKIAGMGTGMDIPEAVRLYTQASAAGHPVAMFRLGGIMAEEGPYFDLERARDLFLTSASAGFPPAFTSAGDMLFYGAGGDYDPDGAFVLYVMASDEGDPVAMFKCAFMLESGIGTAIDESRSIEMFRKSAEGGIPEAAFKMATLAYEGKVPGGKEESFRWYEKCSAMGYIAADFNLATMYFNGEGVKKDAQRAFMLYKRVADTNHDADAYLMLSRMYMEGEGTEKNPEEGFKMIRKAADGGNAFAQSMLEDIRKKQNAQFLRIDGTE